MNFDWQQITVLAIVVVATSYLVYRGWRVMMGKAKTGCGTCRVRRGNIVESGNEKGFVPLEDLQTKTQPDKTVLSSQLANAGTSARDSTGTDV